MGRIYSREELLGARAGWKREGKVVVFTNGCYDVLHPGHVRLLEEARSLGDLLVLALNSDASVQRIKGPTRPLISENDRADLALLSGADGVHVGDEDLPPADARRLLGPELLVGRTARTLEEARAAISAGADHVGFGPIFGSRSKALAIPPRGVLRLREVAAAIGAPVVAIGGIGEATIGEVARAGAACAAVIEALFGAGDPVANARRLRAAFDAARAGGS